MKVNIIISLLDQKQNKWDSKTSLDKVDLSQMPEYLRKNYKKYSNCIEL